MDRLAAAAAVYAARKRLKTLFITSEWGGQVSSRNRFTIGSALLPFPVLNSRRILKNMFWQMLGESLEVKEGEKVNTIIQK